MNLRKVWVVASTEFGTVARTKAFVISLLLMPIMIGVSIGLQVFARKGADTRPRRFVVVDRAGWAYPAIEKAARAYNEQIEQEKAKRSRFEPSRVEADGAATDDALLALSDRTRKEELYAFIEIPAAVEEGASIKYYSNNPNDDALRSWVTGVVNDAVRSRRFAAAGLDRALVERLNMPASAENLGLVSRQAPAASGGGPVVAAQKIDPIRTAAVPVVMMFLMFFVIMGSAPQLFNTVLEEKMSRISEVLLGSVSPFELMLGKLVGNVGIALVIAGLYLGGGYALAAYYGYGDVVSPGMLAILGLFLLLAILLFGSLYMAVGSACSELKDAQSLMTPVMLISMLPFFFWPVVLQAPSSPLAVGMSLFPPATPYLMLARMMMTPAPPAWQVVLSIVLTTLAALLCVWAASRIFRVGLLMQGKAPSYRELARWVAAR